MSEVRRQSKELTRERIAREATRLFLRRGFDEVTVAQVAAAAGVSKVTVFAHFPRKEDLLLDRGPEAVTLLVTAVRDRGDGVDVVSAVRALMQDLVARRHPLAGLAPGAEPFLRVVAASPALQIRAREWEAELEGALADVLAVDPQPIDDPALLAALIVASLRMLVVTTARQMLNGDPHAEILAAHDLRLDKAFRVLEAASSELG